MNGIANPGNAVAGGVSTGFAAVALIYSFGAISGAHFNPAVTFGAVVGGKIEIVKAALYVVAQIVAGLAAVATVGGFAPGAVDKLVLAPPTGVNFITAAAMEALLTFILVFVIYATAMGVNTEKSLDGDSKSADKAEAKMNFAPIAIGLTLGFLCFLGGSVSGGCFNPARALAPAILSMKVSNIGVYLAGDFVGAGIAAALHTYFFAA
jgi:aquaporin related protein